MPLPLRWSLVLLLGLALAGCSPGRAVESKRLLEDLAAGAGPSTLKETTGAPSRLPVAFAVEGRRHGGDLYRPAEGAKASLVLVPGVSPQGKDDTRLVAFARTLARSGFAVLVPEIENLRSLKVSPADAQPIADALRALAGEGELEGAQVAPRPAGAIAVSYAAGPAILAALDPDTREALGFLLLIGGYYDIEAVVTYFTTGRYRTGPQAAWQRGKPEPRAKWWFLQSNLALIEDPVDRARLAAIARRRSADAAAGIEDLTEGLGAEGRSVAALLDNRDPDRVPALIAALPPKILADLRGLDLKTRDLSGLETKLLLVHGRDDPVIPFTESEALARAAIGVDPSLTLLDNLPHVDLGPVETEDALRLWRAAYELLEQRDRLASEK